MPASVLHGGFVVLDEALEISATVDRSPHLDEARQEELDGSNLCNHWSQAALMIPEGTGILELIELLRTPTSLAALEEECEGNELVTRIVSTLVDAGFAFIVESQEAPRPEELGSLRRRWRESIRARRRPIVRADLRSAPVDRIIEEIRGCARLPLVELSCERLEDHVLAFERLARLHRDGEIKFYELRVVVAMSVDAPNALECLFRLGSTVEVTGLPWPAPGRGPVGLAALLASNVAVTVHLSGALRQLADADSRAACCAWAAARHVAAIRFGPVDPSEELGEVDLDRVDDGLVQLERQLEDFRIVGFPDDQVIIGASLYEPPAWAESKSALIELRRRFLRRRVECIRSIESAMVAPRSTQADAAWVDPAEDLIPNHPELLKIRTGSILADVCAGAGRAARRLAPLVGPTGAVIAIEKEDVLLSGGRIIVAEECVPTVQFRRGLVQRLPLGDESVDGIVCEWSFRILLATGIGRAAVQEMRRVLRPGGRVAVMQPLCKFTVTDLKNPLVVGSASGIDVYRGMNESFEQEGLTVVLQKFWCALQRSQRRPVSWFDLHHIPRLVDIVEDVTFPDHDPRVTLYYTIIAEKLAAIRPE